MKKFAILVGLMALALVIGVTGTSFRPDKASAKPTDVISFNPDVCAAFTHSGTAFCYSLNNSAALAELADVLDGAVGDPDTYADLVDASAAQLGDDSQLGVPNGQSMWVLAFVTNDDLVTFTADEGVWRSTGSPAMSTTTVCPTDPDIAALDADCDATAATEGDGVVVDQLYSGVAADADSSDYLDRGDATLTATQSGIDVDMDYTVVGYADDMTLKSLKTTIQEDSGAPCVIGGYSTDEFTQENALADVSGLVASVVDEDGTELTGIWVAWESSDESDITLSKDARSLSEAAPLSITLFKSKQASAPNLACGGDPETDVTITAAVDDDSSPADGLIEGEKGQLDDEVSLDVVPAPASLTLAADPATIMCDGTTSSVVSATVLGTDGKPVVSGNPVRFDVVALGTANPIIAQTDDKGVASSKITPLSGPLAGVTVLSTVDETMCDVSLSDTSDVDNGVCLFGFEEVDGNALVAARVVSATRSNDCWNPCLRESTDTTDIQGSILVNCQQAAPTVAPPPPVATPNVRIGGPNTGDGGYLP